MTTHTARPRTRAHAHAHADNRHSKFKLSLAITGIAAAAFLIAWNAGLFNFADPVPPAELAARHAEAAKTPEQRAADAKARQAADAEAVNMANKPGTIPASP